MISISIILFLLIIRMRREQFIIWWIILIKLRFDIFIRLINKYLIFRLIYRLSYLITLNLRTIHNRLILMFKLLVFIYLLLLLSHWVLATIWRSWLIYLPCPFNILFQLLNYISKSLILIQQFLILFLYHIQFKLQLLCLFNQFTLLLCLLFTVSL